jgi:hypothetical protein
LNAFSVDKILTNAPPASMILTNFYECTSC